MTQTERAGVIAAMADNFGNQSSPKVGIFWWDKKENELFGVNSAMASELNFNCNRKKTINLLHKDFWMKRQYRAAATGKKTRFSGDYTKIPRGRVSEFEGRGFKIMAGEWINDHPDARAAIIDEFDLPQDSEFIIDSHGGLGHGWTEEFM